jgi:Ca2+-binding RTX toxin-like protein
MGDMAASQGSLRHHTREIHMSTIQGTNGNDTLTGSSGDLVIGGAGDDVIKASGTQETVYGGAGIDTITSSGGNNLLDGGDGDDQIWSYGINDTLVGGAGMDILTSNNTGNHFRIQAGQNFDAILVATTYDYGYTPTAVIEITDVSKQADLTLSLTGRTLNVVYPDGVSGFSVIDYLQTDLYTPRNFVIQLANGNRLDTSGLQLPVALNGTEASDMLIGDASANLVYASAGDDTLIGYGGDDVLAGQLGADRLFGGPGQDQLQGGWGNDSLLGEAGHDLLQGGQGNDTLKGGDGDDTLYGDAGIDWLDSGAGTNLLVGGAGNDGLTASPEGHDTLIGGEGNDNLTLTNAGGTVVFGRFDGRDSVWSGHESPPAPKGTSTLQLSDNILPRDVSIDMDGSARIVRIAGSNSSIEYFTALDQITFQNGTVWDSAAIALHTRPELGDNDRLFSTTPNILVQGGVGNDQLSGINGDTLDGGTGNDQIYADSNATLGLTLIGGDGADNISGGVGVDTLKGGPGKDYLYGGAGKDVYFYNLGDGVDSINDSDSAAPDGAIDVRLGAGITRSSFTLGKQANDLYLMFTGTNDRLRIADYFSQTHFASLISFADGSKLTPADIQSKAVTLFGRGQSDYVYGTTGNNAMSAGYAPGYPYLYGDAGNDTLDAGWASPQLTGGSGNDTYNWGLQSGATFIFDSADAGASVSGDVLQLGAGITPDMVSLTPRTDPYYQREGWYLEVAGNWEYVLAMSYSPTHVVLNLPAIQFANGVTWSQTAILDKLRGLDPAGMTWYQGGNDTLTTATNWYDVAYGGAGSDTYVIGRNNPIKVIAGSSTYFKEYVFNSSLGHSSLYEGGPAATAQDVDTLRFIDGIRPQDVMASLQGEDLNLTVRDSDVQVLVAKFGSAATATLDCEVDRVSFADGTVWDRATLLDLAKSYTVNQTGFKLIGGSASDLINGEDGHDSLTGGLGNDTLIGGAGNDTLLGGLGDDSYVVDRSDDKVTELPGQGKDLVRASADYTAPDNVETLVLTGTANLRATAQATVGTTLIGNEGNNLLTGGTGGDTLSGNGGTDTLIGGSGSDYYYLLDEADTIIEKADDEGLDVIFAVTEATTMAANVEALFMKSPLANSATGSADDNTMYASQTAVSFDGQAGNDLLVGSKAGDTLIGGQGDDELQGGKGNDLYTHRAGDGFDTLLDTDATAGNTDTLSWEGVSADQLWLSRSGNDLQIQVLGSDDGVRIGNWYQGSASQIERITVGAQTLTNGRVQALVQQMSAFSPPAGGIGSLNAADQATLTTALNTAWQG